MFKKLSKLEKHTERLEAFNLIKFSLSALLVLTEFLWLGLLIGGLGGLISIPVIYIPIYGDYLALGMMLLSLGLVRLPYLYTKGTLYHDFGQDPRSGLKRLKLIVTLELRRGLVIWLASCLLFYGLVNLDFWYWLGCTFALFLISVSLVAFYPKLWWPLKLRPLQEGDVPEILLNSLKRWEDKNGLTKDKIVVSTTFTPELQPPYLLGLKPRQYLVIPEKALASFPPQELNLLLVMATLEAIIKIPSKIFLLYLCSISISIPLTAILLNTLGVFLWSYPLVTSPLPITLVWFGAWLGLRLADFSTRLIFRTLGPQLAAAATTLLNDENPNALSSTCSTLARYNLEEDSPPAWRKIVRARYTAKTFIKKTLYHQHIAKYKEKKE